MPAASLPDARAPCRSRRIARVRSPADLQGARCLQSLGKVGIVTQCGDNWLPSQTFYLIRTECIDPIWLFHYLRSRGRPNYLRSNISERASRRFGLRISRHCRFRFRTEMLASDTPTIAKPLKLLPKIDKRVMSWIACWIRLPSCSIR